MARNANEATTQSNTSADKPPSSSSKRSSRKVKLRRQKMNSHRRRRAIRQSETPPTIRVIDVNSPNPKLKRYQYNDIQWWNLPRWLCRGVVNLIYHLPDILVVGWIMTWILGGCCSNVYTLEAIVKYEPESGLLITFVQFIFVSLVEYYHHFSRRHPPFFLVPNKVPIHRWLVYTLLFLGMNVLNNYVFVFNISVPVHIILRSGGSVTTLLVGWLFGKQFSRIQVLAVLLLTASIIFSALADADAKGKTTTKNDAKGTSLPAYTASITILFVAQILSAVMGLYNEQTYDRYGRYWHETLFYSHLLSIPFFIPLLPSMFRQLQQLVDSPPLFPASPPSSFSLPLFPLANTTTISIPQTKLVIQLWQILVQNPFTNPPRLIFALVANAYTQYACIRGVNRLAAISTALSVTIVLNIRKLISLFLSCWLFGNELAPGVKMGAVGVFVAGGVYGWESHRVKKRREREEWIEMERREAEAEKEAEKEKEKEKMEVDDEDEAGAEKEMDAEAEVVEAEAEAETNASATAEKEKENGYGGIEKDESGSEEEIDEEDERTQYGDYDDQEYDQDEEEDNERREKKRD